MADEESNTDGGTGQDDPLPTRVELGILVAVVVTSITVRSIFPAHLAVEHFDEGVYASNHWFPDVGYEYPDRHLYAPPLLPWLIEWCIVIFGTSGFTTMLISIVAGSLTVGLVWWVARRWFGPEAGIASAVLCGLSDFHVLYSRSALTDSLLCFWLLLAVHLIWEVLHSRRVVEIAAAGVVTGLAWWTKYTGWLPLAVGLAALSGWTIFNPVARRNSAPYGSLKLYMTWTVIACLALIVWCPVLGSLPTEGGYAAVAANHRKYLVGFSGWPDAFAHQLANIRYLDGWMTYLSFPLSFLASCCVSMSRGRGRFTWNVSQSMIASLLLLVPIVCLAFSSLAVQLIGAFIAVCVLLRSACRVGHGMITEDDRKKQLAGWFLLAWLAGLILATPCYRPYPRLMLPLLLPAWLGLAALMGHCLHLRPGQSVGPLSKLWRLGPWLLNGISVALIVFLLFSAPDKTKSNKAAGWQARTGMQTVATQILDDIDRVQGKQHVDNSNTIRFVCYVYAEPALFFHLSAADVLAQPVGNLDFVHPNAPARRLPTFLVSGPHAARSQQYQEQLKRHAGKFELLATYDYMPSTLVLLNHYRPDCLPENAFQQVRLYLVR